MEKGKVIAVALSLPLFEAVDRYVSELRPKPSRSAFLTMLVEDFFAKPDAQRPRQKPPKKKKRKRS